MSAFLVLFLVLGWAVLGLAALDSSKPLETLANWIRFPQQWFDEPGNKVKVVLWIGVILVNVVVFIWVKDPDSFIGDRRGEAIA